MRKLIYTRYLPRKGKGLEKGRGKIKSGKFTNFHAVNSFIYSVSFNVTLISGGSGVFFYFFLLPPPSYCHGRKPPIHKFHR